MNKYFSGLVAGILLLFFCPFVVQAACTPVVNKIRIITESGQSGAEKERKLAGLLAEHPCEFAQIQYERGVQFALQEEWDRAMDLFVSARDAVKDSKEEVFLKASALGRMAQANWNTGAKETAAAQAEIARQLFRQSEQQAPDWFLFGLKLIDDFISEQPSDFLAIVMQVVASRSVGKGFEIRPSINIQVHFEQNKTTLSELGLQQAKSLAEALSKLMEGDTYQQALVIGHTDVTGKEKYNKRLSLKRANTVTQFIEAEKKALAGRLVAKGYGESEPRYLGMTDEDHRRNRRVEVILVKAEKLEKTVSESGLEKESESSTAAAGKKAKGGN